MHRINRAEACQALAAAGAFFSVEYRIFSFHCEGVVSAYIHADTAADTAVFINRDIHMHSPSVCRFMIYGSPQNNRY
jgi:hypothetical protein